MIFGLSIDPSLKAILVLVLILGIVGIMVIKFRKDHTMEWFHETWNLTKKIMPYLFVGVFIAGMIETLVPQRVVISLVGENTIVSNVIASTFGAFMYFATLTEVPIIQKLMGLGMGRGPALTLFLTGNALSLPSMIVLFNVMGKKQASVYIVTIVALSAVGGWLFGVLT